MCGTKKIAFVDCHIAHESQYQRSAYILSGITFRLAEIFGCNYKRIATDFSKWIQKNLIAKTIFIQPCLATIKLPSIIKSINKCELALNINNNNLLQIKVKGSLKQSTSFQWENRFPWSMKSFI